MKTSHLVLLLLYIVLGDLYGQIFEGTFKKTIYGEPLTPGLYMIVAGDTRAMSGNISAGWFVSNQITHVNFEITNPNSSLVWEIAADGDRWTIRNKENNLFVSFTSSQNNDIALVGSVSSNNDRWDIQWHSTDMVHTFRNGAFAARIIARGTNATDGFSNFAASTTPTRYPVLYKLQNEPIAPAEIMNITQIIFPPPINEDLFINATVTHQNEEIQNVYLHYSVNNSIFYEEMLLFGENEYMGVIPASMMQNGTQITFFIRASTSPTNTTDSEAQKFFVGITPVKTIRERTGNISDDQITFKDFVFKIRGVALLDGDTMSDTKREFYIQDDTAGIFVSDDALYPVVNIKKGFIYEIMGELQLSNQQLQLTVTSESIVEIGEGEMPDPVVNTALYFNDLGNREEYAGQLITILNVSKKSGVWPDAETDEILLYDDTADISLKIFKNTNAIGSLNEPVWPVDLTGILGFSSTVFNQIMLRDLEDIKPSDYQPPEPPSKYNGIGIFEKINSIEQLDDSNYYILAFENNLAGPFFNSTTSGTPVNYLTRVVLNQNGLSQYENPATNMVWRIEKVQNGNYTVFTEEAERYLAHDNSSNNAVYPSVSSSGVLSQWSITMFGDSFNIKNAGTTGDRFLRYNIGSPRFAAYNAGQQYITLYKYRGLTIDPPSISDITQITTPTPANQSFYVSAKVSYSGDDLDVFLRYFADGVQFDIKMILTSEDTYTASIPSLENGTRVEFQILAYYGNFNPIFSPTQKFFIGNIPIVRLKSNFSEGLPVYMGYLVHVYGVATYSNSHNAIDFFVQDETAGINVFGASMGYADIFVGHEYSIIGIVDQDRGLTQINPNSISFIKKGSLPIPFTNTINYFTDFSTAELYEGSLVKINNINLVTDFTWPVLGTIETFVDVTDGIGTIRLRVMPEMFEEPPQLPANIIAILSQRSDMLPHNGDYMLILRSPDDIIPPFDISEENVVFVQTRVSATSHQYFSVINTDQYNEIKVFIDVLGETAFFSFEVDGQASNDNIYTIPMNGYINVRLTFSPNVARDYQSELIIYEIDTGSKRGEPSFEVRQRRLSE